MNGIELLRIAVLVVYIVSGLLLSSLIVGKRIHQRRQLAHYRRRAKYLALLSRGLTTPDLRVDLGPRVAEDQAFLDALIDIRTSVIGPESDELATFVGRFGVMEGYARRLRGRLFVTRRLRAAVALAEVADDSFAPVLMDHLGDREPEIRIQAARGLARMHWTPAIDAIVDRFSVENPWVRSRFEDTLLSFGSKATWPLIAYIRVNHRFESPGSAAAIRTLANLGDRDAVTPLIDILGRASDIEIKLAAIETLGVLGVPLAFESLEKMFTAEDWRLRAKAATALAKVGDPRSLPALSSGLIDSNWWVRRNAAQGLSKYPEGIRRLHAAIRSADPFARDAAAEALADAGEVIAARQRIEEGVPTDEDLELIGFIQSELVVPG
jgi:HEAT repeat protein